MKIIKGMFICLTALIIFSAAASAEEQALLIPLSVKMQTERILEHPDISSAYFIGDDKYIVSYSYSPDNRKIIWESKTGRKIFEVKDRDMSYSYETMRAVSYKNNDREIAVYDLNTGNKIRTLSSPAKGYGYLYFLQKGKYLCGNFEKTRYLWDVDTGKIVFSETGVTDYPWFWIYETKNGNILISNNSKDSDEAGLWNTDNWEKIGAYKSHSGGVYGVSLSKDGKLLSTSGSKDGRAILWDVNNRSKIHTFEGHSGLVFQSLYEDRGLYMTSGYEDKKRIFWDLKTGDKLFTLSCKADLPEFSFIGESQYLATACKGEQQSIDIYDLKKGVKIKTLSGHSLPVRSIASYGKTPPYTLLSSSPKEVILWDLANARQFLSFKTGGDYKAGHYYFFTPPDYKTFAVYTGGGEITYWDTATGQKIRSFAGRIDGGDYNYSDISFSSDGKIMLAKQTKDKTMTVFETATGRKLDVIKGYNEAPSVTFGSKSGLGILTKEEKGKLRILQMSVPKNLVDEQYYAGDKAAGALLLERDEKIKELASPRGEFETTAEYQARLKAADTEKARLTNQYGRKIEAVIAQAQKRLYPYSANVALGRYDADKGGFEADFAGQKMLFPVPRAKAILLAKHRENVRVEGMLRYHSADYAQLVNAYLVDETAQEKFAFGLHTGDAAVASTQRFLPNLTIKAIALGEPSGNGIIDAGETGKIVIRAANNGKGTAFGVSLVLSATNSKGLRFAEKTIVGTISPQEEKDISVDITASEEEAVSADVTLKAILTESSDFDSQPVILSFKTKKYQPPLLQIARVDIEDADGGRIIGRGREVTLTLTIQNAGDGIARRVAAAMEVGNKDIRVFSSNKISIGTLRPGESKKAGFAIAVTQKYKGARALPIAFTVTEEHEKYSVRPDIKLALGEEAPEIKVVKVETRETATAISAVDDIRLTPNLKAQQKIFGADDVAVIIGIERYQSLPKTDFSYNDAKLVREYMRALGFAERNIEYLVDDRATLSAIKKVVETRLPNIVKPSSRVLIYYSGHGSPDAATGEAYIVPFDGDPQYLADTAYPLRRLYEKLGRLPAKDILVVTDACFSGTGGRTVLAKGARPIVMMDETRKPRVPDNVIVLSATQGAQISTFFPEKEQGLFTYYFLKALQEGKKDVYSIYQYVKPLVEDEARRLNVSQSPTLSPDPEKLKGRFGLSK